MLTIRKMKYHFFSLICFVAMSGPVMAQNFIGDPGELVLIHGEIQAFSEAVMNSDAEAIGNAYTEDAKIFPNNREIIAGRAAITEYWSFFDNRKIPYHKIHPEEIKVIGNEAYDFGYYEGSSISAEGEKSNWRGKYVIIWKKVEGRWLIYADIWNRVQEEEG